MRGRERLFGTVLVAVVVAAVIAVTGMLVFRDDPPAEDWGTVAAYVEDVAITEEQVDAVIADLRQAREDATEDKLAQLTEELDESQLALLREQELSGIEERLALDRTRVIEMRILTEAGRSYAEETDLPVANPDAATVAEDVGLDPHHAYVAVVANFFAVMNALQERVEPISPTEDDQREVYDNLVAGGLDQVTFEQAQEVLTVETIGIQVGLRSLLNEVVAQGEVRVNPEYDLVYRIPVPVGERSSWFDVPLGG